MRSHVSGDRRALRELSMTNLTRKGLLARMSPQVGRQVSRLGERLAAPITLVRFFALENKK
jgi:hypothetical protein